MEVGRDACLRVLVERLGSTDAGREHGLGRLESLEDLRATVPIRDLETHEREVTARLGFVASEGSEVRAFAELERDHAIGVWLHFLGERPPERVALLRAGRFDRAIEDVFLEDLRGLGGTLLHIDRMSDAAGVLARLEAFDPDLLVVASALTCRFLEGVHGSPLETRLRSLRLILAEHDIRRPMRTHVDIRRAGWLGPAGRIGLASVRPPVDAFTLAVGSQILELLPYTNPEDDARRVYAERTVLPEDATVSHRYELVLTSPAGFLRVRTGEHVRVVGFDAPSAAAPFPRPRVVRLSHPPADVQLEGCTVGGAWLTASIRQALGREDPALVQAEIGADPMTIPRRAAWSSGSMTDVFADTELGWLARTGMHRLGRARPRGLLVRIELQGHVDARLAGKLSQRIDQSLARCSPAYAHLREQGELVPPRIVILEAGTRRRDEQRRITSLSGRVWAPEVRVVEA